MGNENIFLEKALYQLQDQNDRKEALFCNELTQEWGLALTEAEAAELAVRRREALNRTGRVEFGEGILPKLTIAFRDSPYIQPRYYAETLAELQDIFYYFKGESEERLSDDELIEWMQKSYNGPARGSLDYLAETSLEAVCRCLRTGEIEADTTEPNPEEEE